MSLRGVDGLALHGKAAIVPPYPPPPSAVWGRGGKEGG